MEGEGEGSLFGDQWKEKVIFYLFPLSPQTTSFRPSFFILCDAIPSPRVNPLEGSLKCSCGKLGLGRRSRLPTLEKAIMLLIMPYIYFKMFCWLP
jgi:hypothetical protein